MDKAIGNSVNTMISLALLRRFCKPSSSIILFSGSHQRQTSGSFFGLLQFFNVSLRVRETVAAYSRVGLTRIS